MQLIVLDLEWNQPTSYQSAAYRRVGDRLLFEVIQFGAAKLDEGAGNRGHHLPSR